MFPDKNRSLMNVKCVLGLVVKLVAVRDVDFAMETGFKNLR